LRNRSTDTWFCPL